MASADRAFDYQPHYIGNSRWAVGIFVASILTACAFFILIPSVLTFIVAIVINAMLNRQNRIGGHGFSAAAIAISGCGILGGLATLLLMPSLGCTRCLSTRGVCAANLRGVAQSMMVYSADNSDEFPIVPFSIYVSSSNAVKGVSTGAKDGDAAMRQLYARSSGQAGSVQACMWVLVLSGQVSAKQFVCKSDPFASGAAPTTDNAGNYLNNFQSPTMLSYSMAYPWSADGKSGAWWASTGDATLPLLADMNPRQGTGTPARNMTAVAAPKDPRTWNSANHQGDGQNVAYADAHAEFQRRPDVGQDNDNIYTMSGSPSLGPAQFGGIQAGAPNLTAMTKPFDIIMLPVRDETTGGM